MRKLIPLLITLISIPILASAQDLSKPRKWTSTAGTQFEATVVSLDLKTQTVQLKGTDGRILNIQLRLLSAADKALLQKWHQEKEAKEKGTGGILEAGEGKLAAFADGKYKNYNTVYEGREYDALLRRDGIMLVYPKDKGERLGKPVQVYMACHYVNAQRQHIRRPIVTLSEAPEPAVVTRPPRLRLRGKFEDNVTFDMEFYLKDDKVTVEGSIKDPRGLEFPSYLQNRLQMTATHKFPETASLDEIKAATDGYELQVKSEEGREKFPFWKAMKRINNVEELKVTGPWQHKSIRFQTPATKDRESSLSHYGHFYIYTHNSPFQGFFLYRRATSGLRNSEVILRIRD